MLSGKLLAQLAWVASFDASAALPDPYVGSSKPPTKEEKREFERLGVLAASLFHKARSAGYFESGLDAVFGEVETRVSTATSKEGTAMMKSPIDTAMYMRDMGRGYPEFDYVAAWREVRPMWDALSPGLQGLFQRVREEAGGIVQDKNLDLPWPKEDAFAVGEDLDNFLRVAFLSVPPEELEHAASVIWALGHWMPGE